MQIGGCGRALRGTVRRKHSLATKNTHATMCAGPCASPARPRRPQGVSWQQKAKAPLESFTVSHSGTVEAEFAQDGAIGAVARNAISAMQVKALGTRVKVFLLGHVLVAAKPALCPMGQTHSAQPLSANQRTTVIGRGARPHNPIQRLSNAHARCVADGLAVFAIREGECMRHDRPTLLNRTSTTVARGSSSAKNARCPCL